MDLPSLPFMKGTGEEALAKGEVGFINFVIKPWYQHVVKAFPMLDFLTENIENNLSEWNAIVESYKQVS